MLPTHSTIIWLALAACFAGWTLACGGGQPSDVPLNKNGSPVTVERPESKPAPTDQPDRESVERSSTPPGPSEGALGPAATPTLKDQVEEQTAKAPGAMLKSFNPATDGFGFANFSGGSGPASILVKDLVELFGADDLCIPGDSGRCEPYPGVQLFLEQLNGVLANGLCYGISASVTNYFSGDISLGNLGPEASDVADLSRSDDLDHSIAKLHMMQFSEEYRDVLDIYMAVQPEEIARELIYSFENLDYKLTPPYTLALYSEDGGHAVTPIRAEVTGSGYRIFVYDSNWPKETRWVDIDGSRWHYQATEVDKESQNGLWTGQGTGSMSLIPHMRLGDGFRCFFCQKTGLGLSKSTGSVIMVNTREIKNTAFEMFSEDGETMRWTTAGRSAGLSQVKTYLLSAGSDPANIGSDILLVFVPAEVDNFEVNLTPIEGPDGDASQAKPFELILAGPGIPTTVAKGLMSGEYETDSAGILEFSKDQLTDTVTLTIDSQSVETVESATMRSTTFVELSKNERYEAIVVADALDEVVVVQKETGEVVYSLSTILDTVETPLKKTETGDGIRFSKFSDGSVKIESPDNDLISKAMDAGYGVTFSDGTTGSFEINENRAMIGTFSDGSTSIRFKAGNGIHSTADGWIIDEPVRGEYKILRENSDGVLEKPSLDDLYRNDTMSEETKDIMRGFISKQVSPGDTGQDSPSSGKPESGSLDTPGSVTDGAETISEKYGFLERVKKAVAKEKELEGVASANVAQEMLELMKIGGWRGKAETTDRSKDPGNTAKETDSREAESAGSSKDPGNT